MKEDNLFTFLYENGLNFAENHKDKIKIIMGKHCLQFCPFLQSILLIKLVIKLYSASNVYIFAFNLISEKIV